MASLPSPPGLAGWHRDRLMVGLGLALTSALGWAALAKLAADGAGYADLCMVPAALGWDGEALVLVMTMWMVMTVAMMLPAASPMILTFTRVHRHRNPAGALAATAVFVAGYLVVWAAFSALAATAQLVLQRGLPSAMGGLGGDAAGVLLVLVGAFQWSPLKAMCLDKCRTPLGFLLAEWREGTRGAWTMGMRHGLFCTGCCWALMVLMFVGGAMNLAWMAALTAYMLIEKLVPARYGFSRMSGAALVAAGLWTIFAGHPMPA